MPRVTCRCGQVLSVPTNGPDRVICPQCSARIKVRRDEPKGGDGDGFIRFPCPCGRRLKVRAGSASTEPTPQSGLCPDCGAVVPVPTQPASSPSSSGVLKPKTSGAETPTDEMSVSELAALDRWTQAHLGGPAPGPGIADAVAPTPEPEPEPSPDAAPAAAVSAVKAEAGLRICPRCGRPLHLSAVTCRECGAPAPKR